MSNELLQNSTEVLGLMAQAEAGVRDFYAACAAQWEEDKEFWLTLAAEEDGHFKAVQRMVALAEVHPERYAMRGGFDPVAYVAFIDWVRSCKIAAANGTMDQPQAVQAAGTIENTVLESRIQELVITSDPEFLALLGSITEQTGKHAIMVKGRTKGLIK